jgi:hypothetical protein
VRRRMKAKNLKLKTQNYGRGSALVLVLASLLILMTLGVGMLMAAYGVRHKAIRLKNETVARLAAEAGYEKAIFWMSQQQDMLIAIQNGDPETSGTLDFSDADCDYQIKLFTFVGYQPVYSVISTGHCGMFERTVDVRVIQAISGWDMGQCRVASGSSSTTPVYFANGEIVDIPLHINKLKDNPDNRDIYITGSPKFLQQVGMGEGRYAEATGSDKFGSVMGLFNDGIYFDQPDCKVTDEASIASKVDRFKNNTKTQFKFTPASPVSITNKQQAVHLEFFVEGGVGKVRITNNCAVRGFRQGSDSRTWDLRIKPGTDGKQYERYYIYSYHIRPANADSTGQRFVSNIEDSYVTQSFGGVSPEPGGQIFVNGNVIIGSGDSALPGQDVVKGKVTVVATGSVWIADSTVVDGAHDADGIPSNSNPNVLGLIAQGVIKVIDPGISQYSTGGTNNYPGPPTSVPSGYVYVPVARYEGSGATYKRNLPDPTVVEAAITSGGGGWGAENVARSSYGGRKEYSGPQDDLVVRGTITEALRGVVGAIGSDGYLKHYYVDERFLQGILPGDIWLRGSYIPAPAGWHDYRASN